MVQEMFQELCEFILTENDYFTDGFCNVTKLPGKSIVVTQPVNPKDDFEVVFPNDRLTNYFYIRTESNSIFTNDRDAAFSDCIYGATGMNIPLKFVCVMKSPIDVFQLLTNIISTLANFKNSCVLVSSNWNRETIVTAEMNGGTQEDIEGTISRLDGVSLLSVNFTLLLPIEYLFTKCIINPCQSC